MAKLRLRHQTLYRKSGCEQFRSICREMYYDPRECPIKPGFFKATYGSHGIEIIRLYYDKSENEQQICQYCIFLARVVAK